MDQKDIIAHLKAELSSYDGLGGLFLAGSFGNETADQYSDVDFVAVLDRDDDHQRFVAHWKATLEDAIEIVFWNQFGTGPFLLNAVAENWLRVDLITTTEGAFRNRSRDSVVPLIDANDLHGQLSTQAVPMPPSKEKIAATISEFIRVLGLLHVAIGRGEFYTGVVGAGLQRDHILALLKARGVSDSSGGALHLSKDISDADMQLLCALPYPGPTRAELIKAHAEMARVFFPLARQISSDLDLAFPEAFLAATRNVLKAQLGEEFDISW